MARSLSCNQTGDGPFLTPRITRPVERRDTVRVVHPSIRTVDRARNCPSYCGHIALFKLAQTTGRQIAGNPAALQSIGRLG